MSKQYQPPYTITPAIINLIAQISEQLGCLSVLYKVDNLRLHRINRIRTIQGSLALKAILLVKHKLQPYLMANE